MKSALFALVLATTAATACGDNAFPLEIVADQAIDAYCTRATTCHQFATTTECLASVDREDFRLPAIVLRLQSVDLAAGVAGGRMTYDAGAAADCIAAIASTSCDATSASARETPVACIAMFQGALPVGSACAFDAECASTRCTPPTTCADDYTCCYGACATAPQTVAIGGACTIDSDCAEDAFCTGSGCEPLLGSGEVCSTSAQCDFGLLCTAAAGASGQCVHAPAIGEPCTTACADIGARCTGGTCVVVSLPGEPCATVDDCGPDEVCVRGTCAQPPLLGSACETVCMPGAWCDLTASAGSSGSNGTCVATLADTQPCSYNEMCTSGFCADGEFAETCIEPPVCL